jgi:hypothetical protein
MVNVTYKPFVLSVVMLSVVMLNVIRLNVVMLSARDAVMLSVTLYLLPFCYFSFGALAH